MSWSYVASVQCTGTGHRVLEQESTDVTDGELAYKCFLEGMKMLDETEIRTPAFYFDWHRFYNTPEEELKQMIREKGINETIYSFWVENKL